MDFDNLKELRRRNIIDDKSYITSIVDFAKIFLEKNMKLEVQKIVEKGCYGGMITAKEEGSSIKLSVKVVIAEKCPKQYFEIWPSLKHPNIHRLLDMQYISRVDAYIFVMECPSYTLESYIESPIILENPNAPVKIKGLLWGILEGLEYLHDRGYSHLALKPKNILILNNDKAVISNFSSLDTERLVPNNTKVDLNYGPPEMHFQTDSNLDLFGGLYDIWSVGILTLNIFTKGYIQKKIPEDADWQKQVYPTLQKVLEMCKFSKCIKEAFPAAKINKKSMKLKINFIMTCLRILPADRPSPRMLLRHGYFNPDGGFITVYEQPWNKKRHLRAESWMLNRPAESSNECATGEIVIKSNINRENDNILENQDTKLAKSLEEEQKSAKVTKQNHNRFPNEQSKETKESNSGIDEPMKYPKENESNNHVQQINDHGLRIKKFGIFRYFNKCVTKETMKESKMLPSKRNENEAVKENRTTDKIPKSRDSKPVNSSNINIKETIKVTAVNQQNEQIHDCLMNSENKNTEMSIFCSEIEESRLCFKSNKSDNCLEIHEGKNKKINSLTNKDIILDSGLSSSTQKNANGSAEILGIDVINSSHKEIDDNVDIGADEKPTSESESFDDYCITTRMNLVQQEINDIKNGFVQPKMEEYSFVSKTESHLSEPKAEMNYGDNSTQEMLIDEAHSECLTNFSLMKIKKEEEYNETRSSEEEFYAKQCHKEAEETDLNVFHFADCSSCSLSTNENLFIKECDEENYTFNSMKFQLTDITKDKSRVCILQNHLNLLEAKQSISVSLPEIEIPFNSSSGQTNDNLNSEVTARKKSVVFKKTPSRSYKNQESVTETSNWMLCKPQSNVELGQFDVRVHGDVVSMTLKEKQIKGGNCGDDNASNS